MNGGKEHQAYFPLELMAFTSASSPAITTTQTTADNNTDWLEEKEEEEIGKNIDNIDILDM